MKLRNRRLASRPPDEHGMYGVKADNDRVHLPGVDAHDSVTLCGDCWPEAGVEEVDEVTDCPGCLAVVEAVKRIARTRRLFVSTRSRST